MRESRRGTWTISSFVSRAKVIIIGVIAIIFAIYLARDVMRKDTGTPEMRDISDRILEGALAYLKASIPDDCSSPSSLPWCSGVSVYFENDHQSTRALRHRSRSLGAALSGISGFIGMYVAVRSNIRTAAGARKSLADAMNAVALVAQCPGSWWLPWRSSVAGVYLVVYQFAEGALPTVAETPY
ncbi:MAG: sodium/proton-translocating pyrophosphatase [Thermomicrobiales bacterium]